MTLREFSMTLYKTSLSFKGETLFDKDNAKSFEEWMVEYLKYMDNEYIDLDKKALIDKLIGNIYENPELIQ